MIEIELVNNDIEIELGNLQVNVPYPFEIDGGNPSSVYLEEQSFNGGTPSTISFDDSIDGRGP